ncbi:hypothetical protein [Microbacterium cremeum]|uniref:hypothetical protein n=1 Tax=Microbacterium cremeum TaxID=2782169 RepID=UPI001889695F|nr:hypothetical protein [Microbacterium cremeum]
MHHPLTIEAMVIDQIIRAQHTRLRQHWDPRWNEDEEQPPAPKSVVARLTARLRQRMAVRRLPGAPAVRSEA